MTKINALISLHKHLEMLPPLVFLKKYLRYDRFQATLAGSQFANKIARRSLVSSACVY